MDRKKVLSLLLLLWVVVVVTGGISRMTTLGKLISPSGPQALAADNHGGFFLATNSELLHFDAEEKLIRRQPAQALGLSELNAITLDRDGTLWMYDSQRRRIFRCHESSWKCSAFGPENLGLDDNVFLAVSTGVEKQILVSDNAHHRLVILNESGHLLDAGERKWHFPNQIINTGDEILLADTDRFMITRLNSAGISTGTALTTKNRPYRFTRRGEAWWVIEAGTSLLDGELRHYHQNKQDKLTLDARDPVAILDIGQRIILASKADWTLLSINPETGNAIPAGDIPLQQEFTRHRLTAQAARSERSRLPFIMMALMAPALLGGMVLQRRIDANNETESSITTNPVNHHPARQTGPERILFGKQAVRIETDRTALDLARTEQNRQLMKSALLLVPLLLISGLALRFLMPDSASGPANTLLVMLIALPCIIAFLLYIGRRQQDRLYDQYLVCGPEKLVHVVGRKAVRATPYQDIWLGDETLILGKKRIALYQRRGRIRTALWTVADIQREIGSRIPGAQQLNSDYELGKMMLKQGRLIGLHVLSARFLLGIAIALLLLLKTWSVAHNLLPWKLWGIFHRF